MSKASELVKSLREQEGNGKQKVDVGDIIKEVINTKWSGSNEEQGKIIQLMRGLAFSDDERSNKFLKAIDEFTSSLKVEDYV